MAEQTDEHVRYYLREDMVEGDDAQPRVEVLPTAGGAATIHSSQGYASETNEDAAAVIDLDVERSLLILADGAGGYAAGEEASALAVDTLAQVVLGEFESAQEGEASGGPPVDLAGAILRGFDAANAGVLALGTGSATTLLVVEVGPEFIRAYHVGDSQAILVGQRSTLRMETLSHSPVGYGVEAGIIAQKDALAHEDRHLVSNLVGSADMRIEIGPLVEMHARDTLLLASDGLFDNLHRDAIIEQIRAGAQRPISVALARAARRQMESPLDDEPSKPDDLTFILFRRENR